MKIASFSTRKLCARLTELIEDPPESVVIGRLVEGPNKWFGWNPTNSLSYDHGYELNYYRLIKKLSSVCDVEHFAVCPTYYHESTAAVQLTSLTKISSQGILVQEYGEPITIWKNKDTGFRGRAHKHKLCFWLEHWQEVKKYFHSYKYILWGEEASEKSSFKDKLFHYNAHKMQAAAEIIGKNIYYVREKFVTEQYGSMALIEMFHTRDFKYSGEIIGDIEQVHKDTFKRLNSV